MKLFNTTKPVVLLSILFLFIGSTVSAHPGNTAADGCHYCRTNCDKWGVAWDERHCHGGGESVQEVQQYYSPPTNTPRPLPTWTPIPTLTPKPTITSKLTNTVVPTRKRTVKQVKKVQNKAFKKKQVAKKPTAIPTVKKGFFQSLFGN